MDWRGLADRLRGMCTREVARGDGWVCHAPAGDAIDVRPLLVECATREDLDDWNAIHGDLREEDVSPSGTAGALHDEWESVEVIVWEWVGRSSAWHGSIGLFDAGDGRQYVTRFLEDTPYQVLGCISPKATRASFTAFFKDLMHENGDAYGIDVLGSLPATTELHRPELVTRDTIAEVYREWLDDAEAAGHPGWDALRDMLDDLDEDNDDLDFDDQDDDDGQEDSEGPEEEGDEAEDHAELIATYCESSVLIFDEDDL
jgi:hypothetical protein